MIVRDFRGFTLASRAAASDLMGLLERVSQALGVMTHQILEQGGVMGDFHGDAAMGFWGWPSPRRRVERACRAALAVRAEFDAAARSAAIRWPTSASGSALPQARRSPARSARSTR